jgi:hypothetical protein
MSNPLSVALLASTTASSGAAGVGIDTSLDADAEPDQYRRSAIELQLQVTAASGTDPTLDVYLDTSPNDGEPWVQAAAFAQQNAQGLVALRVAGLQRYVRARYGIGGGTPSFTFALSGVSHFCFATPNDMIVPADALTLVTGDQIAKHLLMAHGKVLSYVRAAHEGNIVAWGHDLRDAEATIATKHLLDEIGWRPGEFDQQLVTRYVYLLGNPDQPGARGWLDMVKSGDVFPEGLVDETPETHEGGGYVISAPQRGF